MEYDVKRFSEKSPLLYELPDYKIDWGMVCGAFFMWLLLAAAIYLLT